ncbi:MAG: MFS transporter [Planctomycetes bacterium]|nr:MFS transporter [Planctomycetota bacterium]
MSANEPLPRSEPDATGPGGEGVGAQAGGGESAATPEPKSSSAAAGPSAVAASPEIAASPVGSTSPAPDAAVPMKYAYWALALLTCINLLNYIDRYVVATLLDSLEKEFTLSKTQAGLLTSVFVGVYLATSPIFGHLGDRWPRRWIVGASVAIWSFATGLAGSARSFAHLLVSRGAVGVGEAGYGPVAPTLITDYFPPERRGLMLAIFYSALPIGTAAGMFLGGVIGGTYGWRVAFWIVGWPGVALAVASLFLREPPRGARDPAGGAGAGYGVFLRSPCYLANTAALSAMTFALGGLGIWLPTFLIQERGLTQAEAGIAFGLVTAVAGGVGTAAGGWLSDRLRPRFRSAPLLVSAVGFFAAVPAIYGGLLDRSPSVYWPCFFIAEALLFLNNGPLNAVIVEVTPAAVRARAFAVSILVIHLFGDVASPPLLGALGDRWNLQTAFLFTVPVIAVAGLFCLAATRTFAREAAALAGPSSAAQA